MKLIQLKLIQMNLKNTFFIFVSFLLFGSTYKNNVKSVIASHPVYEMQFHLEFHTTLVTKIHLPLYSFYL